MVGDPVTGDRCGRGSLSEHKIKSTEEIGEQIHDIMDYYRNLVQVLAEMGLKNLELALEFKKEQKQPEMSANALQKFAMDRKNVYC